MSDINEMFRERDRFDPASAEFRRSQDDIIERFLPVADNIARRFSGRSEPLEDLIQVARLGLVCAVKRFNPERCSEFISFAAPTITGFVRQHFRDSTWPVHVPRCTRDLATRIGSVRSSLMQELGRDPSTAEIAAELGVDSDAAGWALAAKRVYSTVSLEGTKSGDGMPLGIAIGRNDPRIQQIEDREVLRLLLLGLPDRERTVLLLRYFDSLTQEQIASRIGISQMHVCRLLTRSLNQLREQLYTTVQATS